MQTDQPQQLLALLRILLALAAALAFALVLLLPIASPQPLPVALCAAALGVFYLALLLLLRKKRLRLVGLAFLFASWLALGLAAAILEGGFSSPFLDAYVLLVATAGLLLGSEIGYAFTTLSLVAVIGFYLLERSGLMLDQWTIPSAEFVTSLRLVFLLLAYILTYLIAKSIKAEVARTHLHRSALEERNAELRSIQETLEQRVLERSAEIREQNQYFKALVENIPVAVVTQDLKNRITACNPAFEKLFQYSQAEAIHKRLDDLVTNEKTQAEAENYTRKVIQGEVIHYKSVRYRKDKQPVEVEIYGVPVIVEERQVGVLVLYHDITELMKAEVLLQHIASHDSLTGLPNRMLFFDRLSHAIQKTSRLGGKLAVAFLDLNDFKKVNDTYGHGKGDLILKDVAERLKSGIRISDTIARIGGDEFTFIFEAIGQPQDALNISQKIVDTLAAPFHLEGRQVVVSASIGVSLFPDDGDETAILLRKADEAMYASKMLGQNKSQLYSPEIIERAAVFQEENLAVKR